MIKATIYLVKYLVARYRAPVDIKAKFNAEWVIITGASSGVGKSLALQCDKQGVKVFGVGRDATKLQAVKEQFENPENFVVIQLDLAEEGATGKVFEVVGDTPVGCLFLCHGAGQFAPIEEIDDNEIAHDVRASVIGSSFLIRDFMKKCTHPANVTMISSQNGFRPSPYCQIYGAEKSYYDHFGASLQMEARLQKVSVVVISPGVIKDTDFFRNMHGSMKKQTSGLSPEIVARACLATAGTNASYDMGLDNILMRGLLYVLPSSVSEKLIRFFSDRYLSNLRAEKAKNE